ncbi:MAG: hypothetical protein M3Z31_03885, partial [Pseudomonadota bacterium]|nr:hypothetical protein [Pseudomonadota bacterium]
LERDLPRGASVTLAKPCAGSSSFSQAMFQGSALTLFVLNFAQHRKWRAQVHGYPKKATDAIVILAMAACASMIFRVRQRKFLASRLHSCGYER